MAIRAGNNGDAERRITIFRLEAGDVRRLQLTGNENEIHVARNQFQGAQTACVGRRENDLDVRIDRLERVCPGVDQPRKNVGSRRLVTSGDARPVNRLIVGQLFIQRRLQQFGVGLRPSQLDTLRFFLLASERCRGNGRGNPFNGVIFGRGALRTIRGPRKREAGQQQGNQSGEGHIRRTPGNSVGASIAKTRPVRIRHWAKHTLPPCGHRA